MLYILLFVAFLALLALVFRPPIPSPDRLLGFLLLLGVAGAMAYLFYTEVLKRDADPGKLFAARTITNNKIIDLSLIVPGLSDDLDLIRRIDTDGEDPDRVPLEWVVFYRYDMVTVDTRVVGGPYGGAIYDADMCRPPAILSYELVPVSYDYLGQIWTTVAVENVIPFADPLSGGRDRPEVIVTGLSAGNVPTDLNFFRKVGVDPNCLEIQAWRLAHPGQIFPYAEWLRYDNLGSFRGNFAVARTGSTVSTFDRSPFERSQIVIRKDYRPQNGSYFRPGTQTLYDPVEFGLEFGTGVPTDVPEVYYPEKVVLAFYKALGKDAAQLALAKTYLSQGAQQAYNINTNSFGLYTGADSVARARADLARVLVWEIRYDPDVEAERLHQERLVTVIVVGVNAAGAIDYDHPCQVTWRVIGVPNPTALPYGCEWRLDNYVSTCPGEIERGQNQAPFELAGRFSPPRSAGN